MDIVRADNSKIIGSVRSRSDERTVYDGQRDTDF